jgi:hypothetical protein
LSGEAEKSFDIEQTHRSEVDGFVSGVTDFSPPFEST